MAAPWNTLNGDVLCTIASFLTPCDEWARDSKAFPYGSKNRKRCVDPIAMACTCSSWRTLLTSQLHDAALWKPIFKLHFKEFLSKGFVDQPDVLLPEPLSCYYDAFTVLSQILRRTKHTMTTPKCLWGEILEESKDHDDILKDCIFTVVAEHGSMPRLVSIHTDTIVGMGKIGDRKRDILSIQLPQLHRLCQVVTEKMYDSDDYSLLEEDIDADSPVFDDYMELTWERNSLRRADKQRQMVVNYGIKRLNIFLTLPSSLKTVLVQRASNWSKAAGENDEWDTELKHNNAFMGQLAASRSCRLLLDSDDLLTITYSQDSRHGHYTEDEKAFDDYDEATETVQRMRDFKDLFLRKTEASRQTPQKKKRKRAKRKR